MGDSPSLVWVMCLKTPPMSLLYLQEKKTEAQKEGIS